MGEDESGWTRQGRAQFILDNLIAASRARPMLVVMDRGPAGGASTPPFKLTPETADGICSTSHCGSFTERPGERRNRTTDADKLS